MFALVFVVASLASTPGARAQAVPDTTAPWRYYPLGTGDTWETADRSIFEPVPYGRTTVTGDTTIAGVTYATLRRQWFRQDWTTFLDETTYERYDTTAANVMRWDAGTETALFACRLDTPFGSACGTGGVEGRPDGAVQIGTDLVETAVKNIGSGASLPSCRLAAGIGMEFCLGDSNSQPYLAYVRVGGVEYGERLVAEEAGAVPTVGLSVTVGPNPVVTALRVSVTGTAGAQTAGVGVVLEAFDGLGRQVWQGTGTDVTMDIRTWPAGVYAVRASVDGQTAATRVTVAR